MSSRRAGVAGERRTLPAVVDPVREAFTQAKLADGTAVWQIPEAKVPTVQLDATWASYPLDVRDVKVGNVKDMFAVGRLLR